METIKVSGLAITAVKGTRLRSVESIELGRDGAAGDRRFFLIDERDRKVNGKQIPELMTVISDFDEPAGQLTLTFDDGTAVTAEIGDFSGSEPQAYGDFRVGHLVDGPFSAALSRHIGQPLRLVYTVSAVDRGTKGAASLMSRGSLERLATEAGVDEVDARLFRMLIEVDGVAQHAEDDWVGRKVAIGEALLKFEGHVGRCVVTTRDPESGERILPTVRLLRDYRGDLETTEPFAFGIYGRVLRGGAVRIGDSVSIEPHE